MTAAWINSEVINLHDHVNRFFNKIIFLLVYATFFSVPCEFNCIKNDKNCHQLDSVLLYVILIKYRHWIFPSLLLFFFLRLSDLLQADLHVFWMDLIEVKLTDLLQADVCAVIIWDIFTAWGDLNSGCENIHTCKSLGGGKFVEIGRLL